MDSLVSAFSLTFGFNLLFFAENYLETAKENSFRMRTNPFLAKKTARFVINSREFKLKRNWIPFPIIKK